jgi:hypothetical protein
VNYRSALDAGLNWKIMGRNPTAMAICMICWFALEFTMANADRAAGRFMNGTPVIAVVNAAEAWAID